MNSLSTSQRRWRLALPLAVLLLGGTANAVVPAASSAQPSVVPEPNIAAEAPPALPADATTPSSQGTRHHHHHHTEDSNDTVSVGGDAILPEGRSSDTLVSIFGSAINHGEVTDTIAAVFGNATTTGPVGDTLVTVIGSARVDNHVGGDVVAVLGDVDLGAAADVAGDVIVVGGTVTQDPAATIHGTIKQFFSHPSGSLSWLHAWVEHCLLLGRPLAIAPGLGWAWIVAVSMLALYVLAAAAMPKTIDRCTDTLRASPGPCVLTALIGMILTPITFILLCVTVIGVLVVPFLAIALVLLGLVGNMVILTAIGRLLLRRFAPVSAQATWLALLTGGLIVLGLYLVPVVGFIVYKLTGLLGFGVVLYTLLSEFYRRPAAARTNSGSTVTPSIAPTPEATAPASQAHVATPSVDESLPRAGFWIRMGALCIDMIIVGIIIGTLRSVHSWESDNPFLIALAIYGAIMWKLKSTTVGGIVFHLRVVRVDGHPIEWSTAIVRALSCLLSLVVLGLGFIWIVFDRNRQGWHDKIAGTVVVKTPEGSSLV